MRLLSRSSRSNGVDGSKTFTRRDEAHCLLKHRERFYTLLIEALEDRSTMLIEALEGRAILIDFCRE